MKKLTELTEEILVRNAEGDPDTKATIVHKNKIDYEPKVSVIIPVYNTEEYLRECLDSVVNQTLKEIEIICVDDGSTDSSLEILKEYAQKDNRFTIITQKNLNAGVARNAGLAVAKGKYLSFLDSDDCFKAKMLKTLFENSVNNDCEIGICSGEKILYPDKIIQEMPWLQRKDTEQVTITNKEENIFYLTSPNCWNKIFQKNFVDKYNMRFQNLMNCNDVFFVGLALGLSNKIYLTPEKYIVYKYDTNNQITQKIHKTPLNILKSLELLEKKFKQYKVDKKIITSLKKQAINHFIYALKNSKSDNLEKLIKKFQKFYSKADKKIMVETMKKSMTIPIVFAINSSFLEYFFVTLISLLKNIKNNYYYKIYVFHTELNFKEIKRIYKFKTKYVDIECINVNKYIENINLYSKAHYSKEMYYRILIPEILSNYSKVIYLDSDLIVKSDISNLYNIELEKNLIGGVNNYCNYSMYKYIQKMGIEPEQYINSGVLLFNIRECIKFNLKTKALTLLDEYTNLACPDQDILNIVCKNRIKLIDDSWNFMWQHLFYEEMGWPPLHEKFKIRYLKQKEAFNIIHYTSFKKPWNSPKEEYSSIWWEYAELNPYFKNTWYENLFSIKDEHIKKQHRIITILGLKIKIKRKQPGRYSFMEKIFSVKNRESRDNKWYKVFTILGLKFKFKNNGLTQRRQLQAIEQKINNANTLLKSQQKQINAQHEILNKYQEQINAQHEILDKYQEQTKLEINRLKQDYNQKIYSEKAKLMYKLHKYLPEDKYPEAIKDWFFDATGEVLNLENPQTFNEKIQWLKLYDSTPLKTRLADIYLVRDWVKEKIGEEYLIPLLGIYDKFDDIDFDTLPDQFVLKCNHGSGYNIIITNKSQFNKEEARKKINTWLSEDFAFRAGFEMQYSDIPRKIIAEKYIQPEISDIEIQSWCFGEELKFISYETCKDAKNAYRAIFTPDWEPENFMVTPQHYSKFPSLPEKPEYLDELKNIVSNLCQGFKHVRIDFIVVEGKLIFREMTFTSASGLSKFEPEEIKYKLGEMIKI